MGKTIQVRDVPDSLYAELKRRAALQGLSLSDYVRAQLVQIAEQPMPAERLTPAEWLERLGEREPIDVTVEDILNAINSPRDA